MAGMSKPQIILIAALARSSRAIGKAGQLPWPYIPEDGKRFQAVTTGHSLIMGRKTWEWDLKQKPLANRRNIVVTSSGKYLPLSKADLEQSLGVDFAPSLATAFGLVANEEKVFIVGGGAIYAQTLDMADTLDLTLVEGDYDGDTHFPAYKHLIGTQFERVFEEQHPGVSFVTYQRIMGGQL